MPQAFHEQFHPPAQQNLKYSNIAPVDVRTQIEMAKLREKI